MDVHQPTNFETAVKAEMKRIVRCFQHYDHEQRANHDAARVRQGSVGEFYYVHPDIPGIAFSTRKRAAEYALSVNS